MNEAHAESRLAPLTVLVVDDNEDNIDLTRHMLEDQYVVKSADSGAECLASLQTTDPDVILLDIQMRGMDGFEVLKALRDGPASRDIPVIMLTAHFRDLERVIQGLDLGALDYLTKPIEDSLLLAKVRVAARVRTAEREALSARTELERLASQDALTALFNRRAFLGRLRQEAERSKRHGNALSIIMLDLDRFKTVNDTFGHMIGDEVLCSVADSIRETIRESDVAARLGGEEFAILLPDTKMPAAANVGERLRAALAARRHRDERGQSFSVTASLGVAGWLGDEASIERFLARADAALYAAKRRGRDQLAMGFGPSD